MSSKGREFRTRKRIDITLSRSLELFGPKQEDAYEEAANLVLTGKPSALAKRIMVLICDKKKPLEGCCCAKVVLGLWKRQLPQQVRAAVAGPSRAKHSEV